MKNGKRLKFKRSMIVVLSLLTLLSFTNLFSLGSTSVALASNPEDIPLNWESKLSNNANSADFSFQPDTSIFHGGEKSWRLSKSTSEGFSFVWQPITVKADTTYHVSMWIKGDNAGGGYATASEDWTAGSVRLPTGTYDWQKLEFDITTKPDETLLNVRVVVSGGETDGLWLDDVEMTEEGSFENLILNPGFEEFPAKITNEYVLERLNQIEAGLPVLTNLLEQTKAKEIPTDYETVNYTTIKDFITYGRDDLAQGLLSRANYVADELETLYAEAVSNLQAYLADEKEAVAVPRYMTQKTKIEDSSFIGDTQISTGKRGQEQHRPIFFNGYGHFGQVANDIPKFQDYGTNLIQYDFGVHYVLSSPPPLPQWNHYNQGGAAAQFSLDTTVAHSGDQSIKVSNSYPYQPYVYGTMTQWMALKPSTTYKFSMWVKGENVQSGHSAYWVTTGGWWDPHSVPTGTYDWTKLEFERTTGPHETAIFLRLITADKAEKLWFDDIVVSEVGSTDNLVRNSGFEEGSNGNKITVSMDKIEELKGILTDAEENNIAVDVLLSPHNFPQSIIAQFPEMQLNNGFLNYNIFHPKAKEVIEQYLRILIPEIKDYKSLFSLGLSNEPTYSYPKNDAYDQDTFHQYLRIEHGNIERLNDVYGSSYSSFTEVPIPGPTDASNPQYYDWNTFNEQRFTGWHEWMADIIHSMAPDIPVHAKIMAHALDYEPLVFGIEPELFSEFTQINGNDHINYLGFGAHGFIEYNKFYDLQGSLSKAPIFNSENHLIQDGNQQYIPAQAKHVRTNLWQGAIHGQSAQTMWVWERTNGSIPALVGSVLHRPDVVADIGKTNLDLNRLSKEVTAFQDAKADVAILYSVAAHLYSDSYLTAVDKAYEALSYSGVEVDFVSEKQIAEAKLDQYDLLVVPEATNVLSSTLDGIKEFTESTEVNKGNVVILGDNVLQNDQHNQPLSADKRNAVLAKSDIIPSNASKSEIKTTLTGQLDGLRLIKVVLMDAVTNQPVQGIEWRSVMYRGRMLINVANYTQQDKEVFVTVEGHRIGEMKELISRESFSSETETLQIEGLSPYLFQIEPQVLDSEIQ